MQRIHSEFSDVFTGIECFERNFKLRVKEGILLYQAPPRRVAYTIVALTEELDRLQDR